MQDFFVYILRCSDGSFYTGHTDNLEKRLDEHNSDCYDCYTRRKLPVTLVYHAIFSSRDEAIQAERQIKNWSHAKRQALVDNNWGLLKILAKRYNKSSIPRDARLARHRDERDNE
jgi:predicted GIY-YIG superfamily endonuclease